MILPGSTLGILGSGQLGRMLTFVAKRMGYTVHVLSPSENSPTGQVASKEIVASYEDETALKSFAKTIDVLTVEFENIPVKALELLGSYVPVHPSPEILYICQNRAREKAFLADNGFPHAPFRRVSSQADLDDALKHIGTPSILKTAGFGYDGKGQVLLKNEREASAAYASLPFKEAVLEGFIDYQKEMSVIVARTVSGDVKDFGVIENEHQHHILDVSLAPPELDPAICTEAREIAHAVADQLNLIGVLCTEFFLSKDNKLVVNELAPRPHNSGHLTIEACVTSQFEQQLRAVCGLELGSTHYTQAAAMVNLLGDIWLDAPYQTPKWQHVLKEPQCYLHLYGKTSPREGRKMGHITCLAGSVNEAREKAVRARASLI